MKPGVVKEALKSIFTRPATIQYPKERTPVEPDARGRHYADLRRCIGCSLCMIECPTNAIKMERIPEGYSRPKKNPKAVYPVINYLQCIFCYRCVSVCPTSAYVTTSEYRLASEGPTYSRVLSLKTLEEGEGDGMDRG